MSLQKISKYFLITSLLLLAFLVAAKFIFQYQLKGVFYFIDPDAVYIGNALSYVQSNLIYYYHHPGTPTVLLTAFTYWPLRIYAKLILNTPFIEWAFHNLGVIFLYSRIVQSLLFLLSVFLLMLSTYKLTKSEYAILLSWLSLFSYKYTPALVGRISGESMSLFVVILWLVVFSVFVKNKSPVKIVFLSVISGIAIAVKYTNIVLFLATVALVFFKQGVTLIKKLRNIMFNLVIVAASFIISTWPIKRSYLTMFRRVFKIANSIGPGAAHATSDSSAFDLDIYIKSAVNLIRAEKYVFFYIAIGLIILVIMLFKRKISFKNHLTILFVSGILTLLVLFKYPQSYYLLPSVAVLSFTTTLLVSQLKSKLVSFLLIVFLLWPAYSNIRASGINRARTIKNSVTLTEYVNNNPPQIATLWDFGRTKDFAALWMRGWSRGLFEEELQRYRPDLLELKSDYKTVQCSLFESDDVFNACWDHLYIRKDRGRVFLDKYPNKEFDVINIGDTKITLIESDHCLE